MARARRPRPGSGYEVVEWPDRTADAFLDGRVFYRSAGSIADALAEVDRHARSRSPVPATVVAYDGSRSDRVT